MNEEELVERCIPRRCWHALFMGAMATGSRRTAIGRPYNFLVIGYIVTMYFIIVKQSVAESIVVFSKSIVYVNFIVFNEIG